jgi:hypothetical protein
MSGSKSDYLENAVLNHFTGKSSTTSPTNVYVALLTVVPTDASTGATITETTYGGYTRITMNAAAWNSAASGSISNSGTLTGAAVASGNPTIVALAILDSATIGAGNVLYWMTCPSTVLSTTQTPPTFAAGSIVITED